MSGRRFDQARPWLVLGIAVVVWLVAPVAVKTLARASFFEFTAPATVAAGDARFLQQYWALRLHSRAQLVQAGGDVARVAGSYELAVQQNAELQAEVGRLDRLLSLPPRPGYRLEPAHVLQRDFSAWWQRLVIDKGADYRLTAGAPVVSNSGAVGRVAEVHAYTSVVELVSSPGLRLAALVEGDQRPVSFTGGINPAFGRPRGVVEFLPLDLFAGAAAPDGTLSPTHQKRLLTSGLGGIFPAGLYLGEIVRVEPSTDGLFQSAEVELDPRLAELTEVTVLVPQARSP